MYLPKLLRNKSTDARVRKNKNCEEQSATFPDKKTHLQRGAINTQSIGDRRDEKVGAFSVARGLPFVVPWASSASFAEPRHRHAGRAQDAFSVGRGYSRLLEAVKIAARLLIEPRRQRQETRNEEPPHNMNLLRSLSY